jgi:hypothetical protein
VGFILLFGSMGIRRPQAQVEVEFTVFLCACLTQKSLKNGAATITKKSAGRNARKASRVGRKNSSFKIVCL